MLNVAVPFTVTVSLTASPSVVLPVTFSEVTVPPTVEAACQVLPFQIRSSLAVVLKYWSPVVSALPSLSTLGSELFAPR